MSVMGSAQARDGTQDLKTLALVRRSSLEVALTLSNPHALHAVADYSRQKNVLEAAKWWPHFQDPKAISNLEMKNLDVIAKELENIIKTFPQAGVGSDWGYNQVQVAVTQAQQAYENKDRFFSGKPQKVYHDVMCNLDAHSGVLSLIPQGNTYVSIVTGAVKTLVKASVTHRKTIDDLTRALKEVNDEAFACFPDRELVKSEATQVAIARFYTATFRFYGDALRWFQSSSLKKAWQSLDESFSERFKTALVDIQRLSRLVQRAASTGYGAELRVTKLAVERIDEDVRASLQGMAHESVELRRHQAQFREEHEKQAAALDRLSDRETIRTIAEEVCRQAGIFGTTLPVRQRPSVTQDRCLEDPESDSIFRISAATIDDSEDSLGDGGEEKQLAMVDVSRLVEPLLGSLPRGVRVIDLSHLFGLALDQRIAVALERWMLDTTSALLYLESEAYSAEARWPQVTIAAARIVESAQKIGLPTVSFFCDTPLVDGDEYLASNNEGDSASQPLLGLVHSLIFQLTQLLPPLSKLASFIASSKVVSLKASVTSWPLAREILSKLLDLAPPFLLCVIDGFHALESPGMDPTQTHELLKVLQTAMQVEQKVLKVLFTDSKRAFSLIQAVPRESREIIEGTRKAGFGRGHIPVGRAFMTLKMNDMERW